MLSQIVLILQVLRSRSGGGIYHPGEDPHLGNLFQYDRMIDGLRGILAPGEGAVAVAQNGRDGLGIQIPLPEGLHDGDTGVQLVVLVQLFLGQVTGTGDGACLLYTSPSPRA